MASSVMLSLPRVTAPAPTSRATAVQSCSAVKYRAVRVPQEVGNPWMKQRSLNAIGTPWSGPRASCRPVASRRRAAASAPSASTVMKARSRPSRRSTRARHSRVASTREHLAGPDGGGQGRDGREVGQVAAPGGWGTRGRR